MTEDDSPPDMKPVSVFDEVSDLLKWAQDRVGPLSFIGLTLAAWLWLDFLHVMGLPIGFLSPTSMVALPILFMVVVFAVLLLGTCAMLPGLALWTPLFEGGPSITSLGRRRSKHADQAWSLALDDFTAPTMAAEASRFRWGLIKRWLLFTALTASAWPALAVSLLWRDGRASWWLSVPGIAVLILPTATMFVRSLRRATGRWPSLDFIANFIGAGCLQAGVSSWMLLALLKAFSAGPTYQMASVLAVCSGLAFGIGLLQVVVAVRMARGLYPDLLKHVFIAAIGLMTVMAVIPPVGGRLVAYPLQLKSPGGQTCMVLGLTHDASKLSLVDAAILPASGLPHTLTLDFAVLLDGIYYVRTVSTGQTVYMIPANLVSRIEDCPVVSASAKGLAIPSAAGRRRTTPVPD